MSDPNPDAILRAIEETYGSLAEPNYAFVEKALLAQPYARLLDGLSRLGELDETTDVNDDVSFRYVLARDDEEWAVSLSMVGPYALLLRLPPREPPVVVTAASGSTHEAELVELIERAGVRLLSRKALEREIPFRRPGADEESAFVYHAIISDESLPWWRPPV